MLVLVSRWLRSLTDMWELPNPPPDLRVRLLAVDPGSTTLGNALLLIDPITKTITVGDAFTLNVGRRINTHSARYEMYGAKAERLNNIYTQMGNVFYQLQPHLFIAEAPFVGRFAAAVIALVEVRDAVKAALFGYDANVMYESIDPLTAKVAVGAKVYKGSKDNVRDCVLALQDIIWAPHLRKEDLDEHSIDAIAVGYYRAKCFLMHGY